MSKTYWWEHFLPLQEKTLAGKYCCLHNLYHRLEKWFREKSENYRDKSSEMPKRGEIGCKHGWKKTKVTKIFLYMSCNIEKLSPVERISIGHKWQVVNSANIRLFAVFIQSFALWCGISYSLLDTVYIFLMFHQFNAKFTIKVWNCIGFNSCSFLFAWTSCSNSWFTLTWLSFFR